MESRDNFTFKELIRREDEGRGPADAPKLELEVGGVEHDEPWVKFTNRDRLGLAFSGGGIRSASFNLGVLQTLAHKGVLAAVDYLSTVSGGGYIGGFWSALRRREYLASKEPARFPNVQSANAVLEQVRKSATGEPNEVRHLRQFSRFLVPRVGLTRLETWAGLLAIVGGLIPTLLLVAAVLTLFCGLFVAITARFAQCADVAALAFWWVATVAGSGLMELSWRKRQTAHHPPLWGYVALVALTSALGVGGVALLEFDATPTFLDRLFATDSVAPHWVLFRPLTLPLLGAAVAFVGRALTSRFKLPALHAFLDRAAIRHLGLALLWAGAVTLWEASRLMLSLNYVPGVGVSAVLNGALFLWLREWLNQKPGESRLDGAISNVLSLLKPVAPQVLALLAVLALTLLGIATFQVQLAPDLWGRLPWAAGGAAAVLVTVGLLVDTSRIGLHAFYRRRIARAFLGAVKADAHTPHTVGDASDDIAFSALRGAAGPVHLVCCTANDVQGEALQTLGRGGRSVTLSPWGVSLGAFARDPGNLKLAAGLTASAAAFNSQMGTLSMELGGAVSLLMSAFNLRLGLWVSHPLAPATNRWRRLVRPLRYLALEAAGMTVCDPLDGAAELYATLERREQSPAGSEPHQEAARALAAHDPRPLHLSDGGHFENLGLYELVRRHCRYIIVSDAGADPELSFDDLGNAIRRVREDFSVEIDIDISPLRAVDGVSKQAVVVGTIHYDGLSGSDKGTLLYLKPTLVGGEPPDVLQYRARNASFPHQTTADQFYDEAQWESYRRLGEYVAAVALRVTESGWAEKRKPVDALFLSLRQGWHATPEQNTETFLSFTGRCSELESEIREAAPLWFRVEMFPELQVGTGTWRSGLEVSLDEQVRVVTWVMQLAQLMEDVWLAAKLDSYWSHPLNEGWMTYFHRWAATPSFRLWWPILRGIYSDGFRNFVKERFDLRTEDALVLREPGKRHVTPSAVLDLCEDDEAWQQGAAAMGLPARASLRYVLHLEPAPSSAVHSLPPIPVATLDYRTEGNTVTWRISDLKVPPWLLGSGIQARFLDRVIKTLAGRRLVVAIDDGKGKRDPASRAEHARTIAFYKSRRFTYSGDARTLVYEPSEVKRPAQPA